MSLAAQTIVYLRGLIEECGAKQVGPTTLFVDSQAAMKAAANPIVSQRSKHIDIRYHYIREQLQAGVVKLEYVSTDDMTADCLTKPLAGPALLKHVEAMLKTVSPKGSVGNL